MSFRKPFTDGVLDDKKISVLYKKNGDERYPEFQVI